MLRDLLDSDPYGGGGGGYTPAPPAPPPAPSGLHPVLPNESGQVPPPPAPTLTLPGTGLQAPGTGGGKKKKGKGGGGTGPSPPVSGPVPPSTAPPPATLPFAPGYTPVEMTNPGIGHWYNQDFPQFAVPSYGPDPMDRRPYTGMGGGGAYGDFNDVYNMFLSTVPVMEAEAKRQINSAMANAGFTGNRYSSSAMNTAGQIGADTALKQNQMLNELLYGQANKDLDRQMMAIQQEMQLGQLTEQGAKDRLAQLFGFGSWEQGRMDDMAMKYYQDFEQNKYGFLPMLLQAAMSQGAGSPGSPGSIAQIMTSPGREPDVPPELLTGILGLLL